MQSVSCDRETLFVEIVILVLVVLSASFERKVRKRDVPQGRWVWREKLIGACRTPSGLRLAWIHHVDSSSGCRVIHRCVFLWFRGDCSLYLINNSLLRVSLRVCTAGIFHDLREFLFLCILTVVPCTSVDSISDCVCKDGWTSHTAAER